MNCARCQDLFQACPPQVFYAGASQPGLKGHSLGSRGGGSSSGTAGLQPRFLCSPPIPPASAEANRRPWANALPAMIPRSWSSSPGENTKLGVGKLFQVSRDIPFFLDLDSFWIV
jgi:hypothetical protein